MTAVATIGLLMSKEVPSITEIPDSVLKISAPRGFKIIRKVVRQPVTHFQPTHLHKNYKRLS